MSLFVYNFKSCVKILTVNIFFKSVSGIRRLFFFCRRAANIVVTILSKVLGYKFDILQMMISFFANIAYDQYCD